MDKKKTITIILIALAVAAIAGGGYYLWQKRKDAAMPMDETLPASLPKLLPVNPVVPKYISHAIPAPASVPVSKAGASAYPKGTSVNVRTEPRTTAKVLFEVKKGIKAGIATGETKQMTDGLWYKLQTAKGAGWVRSDVVSLSYV